ncbi:MAG: NHL repeat-containing protein [Anaerolineae bacterium]
MNRLQNVSRPQRILIFVLFFVGGLFLIIALFVFLAIQSFNSGVRAQAQPQVDTVGVTEFVALPDEDAYPASVAVAPDGTVYTASYVTGTIWAISPLDASVTELNGSRDTLGSVTGMAVGPDGTLYVVDQLNSDIRSAGGTVWRITGAPAAPIIESFAAIDDAQGFVEPEDITLDTAGNVYVSDRGRGEVWRFAPDGGSSTAWWTAPVAIAETQPAPNGLAYDPTHDAIIVTDTISNAIYRVTVVDARGITIYLHGARAGSPGFDGVAVTPEGHIYVTLLEDHSVALLTETEDLVAPGTLTAVAAPFRGASDIAYTSVPTPRFYVTNFDQLALVLPGVRPQLPFALDVIYPTDTP